LTALLPVPEANMAIRVLFIGQMYEVSKESEHEFITFLTRSHLIYTSAVTE
jgi:hypothetical protein